MSEAYWTLAMRRFRSIENFRWSPSETCLLAGSNGSGKTTAIRGLQLLQNIYSHGLVQAIQFLGGASHLRQRGAEGFVEFEFSVGPVSWELSLPIEGLGFHPNYGERLTRDGRVEFNIEPYSENVELAQFKRSREKRCSLQIYNDLLQPEWLKPLISKILNLRVYESYWLNLVRRPKEESPHTTFLHRSGQNLWDVLASWKASPRRFNDQFAWVVNAAVDAFPNLFNDLEFHEGPVFYPADSKGPDDFLPIHLASDGLITGLLHLTAIAGAEPYSILAFDELENHLHPHAIRSILASIREKVEERSLTVVLTTHSPVLMNEFKNEEGQFYVLETGPGNTTPARLNELKDPDWLAHFEPGRLYEREKIIIQSTSRRGNND